MDIVSLACLTAVVPFAFRSPEDSSLRHGADLVGLARWLAQAERYEEAVRLFRRAVDLGLPDHLLFKTLFEIGRLEKKLERYEAALAVYGTRPGNVLAQERPIEDKTELLAALDAAIEECADICERCDIDIVEATHVDGEGLVAVRREAA